jgi:hypothetical protein
VAKHQHVEHFILLKRNINWWKICVIGFQCFVFLLPYRIMFVSFIYALVAILLRFSFFFFLLSVCSCSCEW